MDEDLERLQQRLPLLEYLQRHNWTPRRAGFREELVGLCPLHPESRPSFYVHAGKHLFYCHGCGRGGDLIRFIELFLHLSFRQSVAHLRRQRAPAPSAEPLLEQTAAFYRLPLHRHPQAVRYLERRGLRDAALLEELGIG
jgi:DNA primase